jgi:hypothetical protein
MPSKTVVFEDLPKTPMGKMQKFVLHEKARAMGSLTKTDSGKVSDTEICPQGHMLPSMQPLDVVLRSVPTSTAQLVYCSYFVLEHFLEK